MGYNRFAFVRRSGSDLNLNDIANVTMGTIKMVSNGDIIVSCGTGDVLRIMSGPTRMFNFDHSTNVTTVEGGNVTGDDLKLEANGIDTGAFINLVGNGNVVLVPATGSHTQFGTHVATGDAVSNGSIEIKDAGGTVRKLMTKA